MKTIKFTFLFLFFSLSLFAQTDYEKNSHVVYKTTERLGNYVVEYTFKNHVEELCTIKYTLNKKTTNQAINVYGMPKSIYESYLLVPEVIAERKRIIENGLFKKTGNTIEPDKNAIINYYAPYSKMIAEWIIDYLKDKKDDSRMNRIKMVMRFVQDIPYAIPPDETKNKKKSGGIIPAPQIIIEGYGDCDSKAIFFAGIMCYLINPADIRFAGEPGHIYTIIKNNKTNIVKGGTTTYFKIDGATFLIAETAGPGHSQFGEKNNRGYSSATIEKIIFNPQVID